MQALGAAFLVPASLALVLNAFPPERRAHGVALLSAVAAAAAGLGPSLGGILVSVANWRLVFLVNLPIGVVAVVLARRQLIESRAPGRRRMPDMSGALLFALAIASLVLGVVKGSEWGWGSARVLGAFAAALVLGAVFVWRCTWHRSPIIDLGLLRIRTFSAANGMTIIAAAGFYGYTLANVLFLTGVWRYSALQAGLALTPGPFVAAAVAGPTSRLAHRIGPRPVLVAGGLIWGGAVMWLVERVGVQPDFLGEWLPGIVLLGIGAGTLFPNLSGVAVASAPGESFATATGLNSVARQVGAALGVAVIVAIIGTPSPLQALHAFDNAWRFAAACLFVAGIGCLLVGRVLTEGALAGGGRADGAASALDGAAGAAPAASPAGDAGGWRARAGTSASPSSRRSSSPAPPLRRARAGAARAAGRAFAAAAPGCRRVAVPRRRPRRCDVPGAGRTPGGPRRSHRRGRARAGTRRCAGRTGAAHGLAALGVGPGRPRERPAGDRPRALRGAAAELPGAVAVAEPDPRRAAAQRPGGGQHDQTATGDRRAAVAG